MGLLFRIFAYRESKPYTEDTENDRLHFLFQTFSSGPRKLAQKHKVMPESPYIRHGSKGKYIYFPETITKIEPCGLLAETIRIIMIPNGVEHIGRAAFLAATLSSIILPDSLLVIEDDAFCGCTHLQKLYLPENLTHIGARAFFCCDNLKEIIIPESVQYIGNEAFAFCRNLKKVMLPAHTRLGHNVFHASPLSSYSCT